MIRRGCRWAVWVGILTQFALPVGAETNILIRGVSVSRQFVAYAPEELLPHALCVFAEQVKREWAGLIEPTEPWRDPILVVVERRADHPPAVPGITVSKTELHLKYQITWWTPPPLEQTALLRLIVEALCAELANRNESVVKHLPYQPAPIPAWLVRGLARTIQGRDECLIQVARQSLAGGHPQAAWDLLTGAPPEEPLGEDLFEANAWLLTQSLLNLPQGRAKLREYLGALGSTKSVTDAFWQVYGRDFRDAKELERWWVLQVTLRTTTIVAQNLSLQETARRLDRILTLQFRRSATNHPAGDVVTIPLPELGRFAEKAWLQEGISDKRAQLENLRMQAAPTFRPAISGYCEAFDWLLAANNSRYRRALTKATAARLAAESQARAIQAALDRAETEYDPTGGLTSFNRLLQTLAEMEQLKQHRRSPISEYLDQFDK